MLADHPLRVAQALKQDLFVHLLSAVQNLLADFSIPLDANAMQASTLILKHSYDFLSDGLRVTLG